VRHFLNSLTPKITNSTHPKNIYIEKNCLSKQNFESNINQVEQLLIHLKLIAIIK